MYYGLEAFRMYIKIYPTPYEETDIDIIDSLLEGEIAIDDRGNFHPTRMMHCDGET